MISQVCGREAVKCCRCSRSRLVPSGEQFWGVFLVSLHVALLRPFVQAGLYSTNGSDLYVTAQVFVGGRPLMLPVQTAYRSKATRWNEWLTLPIKYRDLPRASVIVFTVWDISARAPQSNCIYLVFGCTTVALVLLLSCEISGTFAFRSCRRQIHVFSAMPRCFLRSYHSGRADHEPDHLGV
jgi:hypothetical protein